MSEQDYIRPSVPTWWPTVAQSSDVALNDTLVRNAANADVSAERLIAMMAERHRETIARLVEAESGRPNRITFKCSDDEFDVCAANCWPQRARGESGGVEVNEVDYTRGRKSMARAMLSMAIRELLLDSDMADEAVIDAARLISQLSECRDALAALCDEHDVEVPDGLRLAVVVKEYVRPLVSVSVEQEKRDD